MPRGRKPGFVPDNKIIFTDEMIKYLNDNFHTLTNKQLADGLGLKLTIVRTKCYELGMKRMELEYWTDEQVKFLKEHYKIMGDVEMAELFAQMYTKAKGWTKKHIEKKRRYLKLKRTEAEVQAIQQRNTDQGRFAINHWKRWVNRVTPIFERRMWEYETGRRFMVIKLNEGFVHYARWLWKQVYGPIPDGYVVRLKDGNPENVVLANLHLISRAENQSLNSYAKYPLELKQAIVLTNKLKKRIKALKNEQR